MNHQSTRGALSASLVVIAMGLAVASVLAQQSRVKVTPDTVRMGAFYGGATVRVEGTTGLGGKIIVIVRGPEVTEVFSQAGRVGPIWVNTGKVTISGVPSLFLVFSSEPVSAFLPRPVIDQYGLDLLAVKKQMRIECKKADYAQVAEDYLAYKSKQGSYQRVSGAFQTTPAGPVGLPHTPYLLEVGLPKCATPGQYQIRVLECRGGEIVASSDVPLTVVEVGFPVLVAWLASQHASFYGIISVLAALVAGLGIDFVAARLFKPKMVGD